MPASVDDVVAQVLEEFGFKPVTLGVADDTALTALIKGLAEDVIVDHTARVGSYSLDTQNIFEAAVLETASRATRRISTKQAVASLSSSSDDVTIGPLSIRSRNTDKLSSDLKNLWDALHRQAEAKLGKLPGPGIRNWTPQCRTTVI